jgi:hypothetical protein
VQVYDEITGYRFTQGEQSNQGDTSYHTSRPHGRSRSAEPMADAASRWPARGEDLSEPLPANITKHRDMHMATRLNPAEVTPLALNLSVFCADGGADIA